MEIYASRLRPSLPERHSKSAMASAPCKNHPPPMNRMKFKSGGGGMPEIGLGTSKAKDEEMSAALESALEIGYRHIDTATDYHNEHVIGEVIDSWFEDGRLKREELFITTKLPVYGNRAADVDKWITRSLQNLRCEYIDLYLIHVPFAFKEAESVELDEDGYVVLENTDHVATWKAMEKEVEAGRVKAIGISNFNQEQIQRILDAATILPSNLQIENHVFMQQPKLVKFCHENNISVTAYSPLGNPSLQPLFASLGISRELPNIIDCPEVKKIADRLGKMPAQVLLRYNVQRGIAVIPKSVNSLRLRQNIELYDFELTLDDMNALRCLDRGEEGRLVTFDFFKGVHKHLEYPFKDVLPAVDEEVTQVTRPSLSSTIGNPFENEF